LNWGWGEGNHPFFWRHLLFIWGQIYKKMGRQERIFYLLVVELTENKPHTKLVQPE